MEWGERVTKFGSMDFSQPLIKSVIDRDGATCRNNNHFERPTILYAPWDEHKQESSDRQTDRQTNGRYQTYNFPCFAVDKN